MAVILNPYISFLDNAGEAMAFYKSVLGGELNVSTFADMPGGPTGADGAKVMHAMLQTEGGITLMGADTPEGMEHQPFNGSISLSGDDEAALRGYWAALVEGGTIVEPLETAPWGDTFGMCVDKFGINWMVNIAGNQG